MASVSGRAPELSPFSSPAPLEAEPAGATQAESSSPDRSRQTAGFHNFIAGPSFFVSIIAYFPGKRNKISTSAP